VNENENILVKNLVFNYSSKMGKRMTRVHPVAISSFTASGRRRAVPKWMKEMLIRRYFDTKTHIFCSYPNCREHISTKNWHAGHIRAAKFGGELSLSNLRPVCGHCNSSKGTMDMDFCIDE
jgi:5-methylcytosine-specific restriction endonuclease McrA